MYPLLSPKTISCHTKRCHPSACGFEGGARVKYSFHLGAGLLVGKLQEKFGNIIRGRRTKAGIGQEALADRAGLHRTHVSLLERGKRNPTLEVIRKLAAALGTTMASLMQE